MNGMIVALDICGRVFRAEQYMKGVAFFQTSAAPLYLMLHYRAP